MPTYTISLSELAYAEFGTVKAVLERNPVQAWKVTHSRQVHYLAHLWHLMHAAVEEGRKMKNAEQCALFYERSILEALNWVPPNVSRGPYKKANYATIEERAYVAAKIRERLGIEPTDSLISEAINAGDAGFLRSLVQAETKKLKEGVDIREGDTLPKAPEAVAKNSSEQLPQAPVSGLGETLASESKSDSSEPTPEQT